MAVAFELLSPTDKPALCAVDTPELASTCQSALTSLGYKVHTPSNHDDFSARFAQAHYHIVLIEEGFGGAGFAGNTSLKRLQSLAMSQRRHAAVLLIGSSFQTLQPMQAFQQSVHAVINPSDSASLAQVIQKVVSDNDLFLSTYRDGQTRLAQGK